MAPQMLFGHLSSASLRKRAFPLLGLSLFLSIGVQAASGAPAPTATTLTIASNGSSVTTVTAGSVVTLTAAVKAGGMAVKPGQVIFCDAAASYCTDVHIAGVAQLTSAGTAVVRFRPGPGSHSYKAVFQATKADASSSSGAQALTVTAAIPTSTAIGLSSKAGVYALTATVSGKGITAPTGTVSFLDTSHGNATVSSAGLAAGVPTLAFTKPAADMALPGFYPAVGDFNEDGIPDVAIPDTDHSVTILLGNGDGTFTRGTSPTTLLENGAIAVADFNSDGHMDLAVADQESETVSILLGDGHGGFTAAPVNQSTGYYPSALVVADFNGDGIPDIAVTSYEYGTVTILLGKGDGTFTNQMVTPEAGMYPESIVSGDFNGDGIPDLAIAGYDSLAITVLLGNGDGSFRAAPDQPATTKNTNFVATGDFNGDGILDLAVPQADTDRVVLFLGNGDGTFTRTSSLPAGSVPDSLAVGDFLGKGNADLAIGNESSNSVSVFKGYGNGVFTSLGATPTSDHALSLAVGDFNGDGADDLAVMVVSGTANQLSILAANVTQTATAKASGITVGPGTHQVDASYPGDSHFAGSVSGVVSLLPPAQVSLSASSESFGAENLDVPSAVATITVTNPGTTPLAFQSIARTGADASSFASSNNCGSALAAAASCTIRLRFDPQTAGALTAAVTLTDDAGTSPQTITLNGTGYPPPTVTLSATAVSFGNIAAGQSSAVQAVTLTNNGPGPLDFVSILRTGADRTSFASSNDCASGMAAHASCTIRLRFDPKAVAGASASLTVTDTATNSPQTITLTGTGK